MVVTRSETNTEIGHYFLWDWKHQTN